MDFITHTLIGAGAARLIVPRRAWLPQVSLAAIGGSLVMDGDSALAICGLDAYGRWHRVASHSLVAIAAISTLVALASWRLNRWPQIRRFGWFVADNLSEASPTNRAPFLLYMVCAAVAAVLHVAADAITGFGNMEPLWPWYRLEISLRAVYSFDWFIFSMTLAWHIMLRWLQWPRVREACVTLVYIAFIIVYVAARMALGQPTFW